MTPEGESVEWEPSIIAKTSNPTCQSRNFTLSILWWLYSQFTNLASLHNFHSLQGINSCIQHIMLYSHPKFHTKKVVHGNRNSQSKSTITKQRFPPFPPLYPKPPQLSHRISKKPANFRQNFKKAKGPDDGSCCLEPNGTVFLHLIFSNMGWGENEVYFLKTKNKPEILRALRSGNCG